MVGWGGALQGCRVPGASDSREGSLEEAGPHQPAQTPEEEDPQAGLPGRSCGHKVPSPVGGLPTLNASSMGDVSDGE